MFSRLIPALRMALIWFFLALPVCITWWMLNGSQGLYYPATIVLAVLIILSIFSERRVIAAHRGRQVVAIGLRKTFQRVLEENHQEIGPELMVYPDPSPNAICVRGIWSRGTILVSQGMVALMSEEELRAILASCLQRSRDSNLVVGTLCGVLASFILGGAPRPWVNTALLGGVLSGMNTVRLKVDQSTSKHNKGQSLFRRVLGRPIKRNPGRSPGGLSSAQDGMTPSAAIRFLVFYPLMRILMALGKRQDNPQSAQWMDLNRINATHKLKGVWDYVARPEYLHLYLLHRSR